MANLTISNLNSFCGYILHEILGYNGILCDKYNTGLLLFKLHFGIKQYFHYVNSEKVICKSA